VKAFDSTTVSWQVTFLRRGKGRHPLEMNKPIPTIFLYSVNQQLTALYPLAVVLYILVVQK